MTGRRRGVAGRHRDHPGRPPPFPLDPDGLGFGIPIGSTAGGHLDGKGRIFHPGGMTPTRRSTGKAVGLRPTRVRVMPQPGCSAGITADGARLPGESPIARTTPAEVPANGRPALTGSAPDRVPFHFTGHVAALTAHHFGRGAEADSPFDTSTPRFDHVPGRWRNSLRATPVEAGTEPPRERQEPP